MNTIDIWSPKFSTNEVLISPYKIKPGLNRIIFTKSNLSPLLIDSEDIRKYPLTSNGSIGVHAVPMSAFKKEELVNQIGMEI